MARQFQLRRADLITGAWGHDQRRRPTVCEITTINEMAPDPNVRRKDFKSLTASYPDKRLTLETGRPAKVGHEITRRAIDLIAPIGYGQRALIVAPARAGKTTLLQAITEGVHLNHPDAVLMLLLVDERPEEVSEAISWDVGEVIASSFDQPAQRHVDVTEIVTERAHRLVEMGKDVVIVLDSHHAHGSRVQHGRSRHGSHDVGRSRCERDGEAEGVLRIGAQRVAGRWRRQPDDHRHGAGRNRLAHGRRDLRGVQGHRQLRDQARSRARREADLSGDRHPGQRHASRGEALQAGAGRQSIYMLRRGLQQMPPTGAMEWLIKRISATANNDALLAGL